MERESIVSHGHFASMFPPIFKFSWGDGIEVTGGFVLGGSGGLEPPTWVSGKSNTLRFPLGKSNRLQNLGPSNISLWDIV